MVNEGAFFPLAVTTFCFLGRPWRGKSGHMRPKKREGETKRRTEKTKRISMKDKKKLIFLLGGYDLEMCTIKALLESHHLLCVDRRLQWHNAYLSAYEKSLRKYGGADSAWHIYGVELQEDILPPPNYSRIDHHNQYAGLPSALEQVADLLQFPLDRRLRLIAANDKAYIPGMKALGASAEEIAAIRSADRRAQGVSEEEERLAEKALAENKETTVGGLLVVRALSTHFSPICDRLFPYARLVVYTDSEWVYYGEGADRIKTLFEPDFLAGRLFCGGGKHGFVGSKQEVFAPHEIHEMIRQIKEEMADGA